MGAKVLISSFKTNLWNHIFQENCYFLLIEFIVGFSIYDSEIEIKELQVSLP